MANNSSSTEDAECRGSEIDKNDKKNPLKQSAIKAFFKIIPKKKKRGGPQSPKIQSFLKTTINSIWSLLQ